MNAENYKYNKFVWKMGVGGRDHMGDLGIVGRVMLEIECGLHLLSLNFVQ
jgi:hypothetical protein